MNIILCVEICRYSAIICLHLVGIKFFFSSQEEEEEKAALAVRSMLLTFCHHDKV